MTNKSTFVFSKITAEDTEVEFDITDLLRFGEVLQSIVISGATPQTNPQLTATIQSGLSPQVLLLLKGGRDITSYGFIVQVTTSARVLVCNVAVVVKDQFDVPYPTQSNPEAIRDLIDSIEAGGSAIGSAVFAFSSDVDPSGGYVTWQMLTSQGSVLAYGNAYDYKVVSNGVQNTVIAKAVINVPSTVPPNMSNEKYQLTYTLILNEGETGQQTYDTSEKVSVVGLNTVPVGTQPVVELVGSSAMISLVTEDLYDTVAVEIFNQNTSIGSFTIPDYQRVSNGYYYAGVVNTQQFAVSLQPYNVVWRYGYTGAPTSFTESAALWIVNPQIMQAVSDVKSKINKARTTLYGSPDLLFPVETILVWLRRAADAFNGAYGVFTNITMINALGSIREYWLLYAELFALESQYLAEGEKAFNFSGQAIQLDVDKTQYLDNMASKIQARLDNEFKPFKQNLIIKGVTAGDGSTDPSRMQPGANGAVGVTITPASAWGRYLPGYPRIR